MSQEHPKRGFAKMAEEDPERLHEIAKKGGEHSHMHSHGHHQTHHETKSKGTPQKQEEHLRGFAKLAKEDPERMHEIAVEGGKQSHIHTHPKKDETHQEGEEHLRGFAKLAKEDPERMHEIAVKGGEHSHIHDKWPEAREK